MRFMVWRVKGNGKPCDEAHLEHFTNQDQWVIDLNTLEELVQFTQKYGDCIVHPREDMDEAMGITIYDGYIE